MHSTAPFDIHRQFWLGFRLLVRLLIFIIAYLGVSDGRALALTVLLVLLTILQAYLKPFSSTSCNLVDLSVVLNLTLLSVVALYPPTQEFGTEYRSTLCNSRIHYRIWHWIFTLVNLLHPESVQNDSQILPEDKVEARGNAEYFNELR